MSENKLINVQGKGPVIKSRSGKFCVSIWHWRKTVAPQPKLADFSPEREVPIQRACVRYSQWDKRSQSWGESSIWCSVDDLRSLVQALDDLNYQDDSEGSGG